MSTTSNFFIEVRKGDKWHLLYALYPFEPRKAYKVIDGRIETIDAKPYTTCENGIGYDRFIKLWKQGSVRDLFNNMMINSPIAKRGLPDDISEDVKSWFDEKLAEVEEEKRKYKEKYGEERSWSGKWWYNESYATVSELWKAYDGMYNNWKERTLRLVDDKWKNSVIIKRLDAIDEKLDATLGKEVEKKESEEVTDYCSYEEDIEYAFGDDLYDVMNLYAFIMTVEQLAESLNTNWYNDSDIRIITYTD